MILNLSASGGLDLGLNFRVIGGTTRPVTQKENTIWVNTPNEITSWTLSPIEPTSPKEGQVWVQLGLSSSVEFNILKKNEIYIYPTRASQYVSGNWTVYDMQTLQNGKWESLWFYVFESGVGMADRYTKFTISQTAYSSCTIDSNEIYIKMTTAWKGYSVNAKLNEPIDVTNYSYAYFTGVTAYCSNTDNRSGYSHTLTFNVGSGSKSLRKTGEGGWIENGTVVVDLRSVTGSQYLTIQYDHGDDYRWYADVWIENIYFV